MDQLQAVLNMLPQPAMLLQQGQILWCNGAASALHLQDMPLSALLGPSDPNSCARFRLDLQSVPYEVCIRPLDHALLWLATSLPHSLSPDRYTALSIALRRPLQELMTAASDLFESLPDICSLQTSSAAAEVNRSIYQLHRLCGQLSEAERLLEDQAPAERRSICLNRFLDRFSQDCAPLLEAAGYLWEYDDTPGELYAYVDAPLLERALYQILANSMTYSAKGSKIHLYTETDGLLFRIHIKNQGSSFRSDSLLFASEPTSLQKDPRCVLGLDFPLAERIAELHGGQLLLQECPDGQGARISLSLSLAPAPISLKSYQILTNPYGGRHPGLVELSPVLPSSLYAPEKIQS